MAQGAARDEGEQSSWLTLSEAAARSGLHKEALRARAKRGQLPCQRSNRGELLVQLPPSLLTPAQGDAQSSEHAAQGIAHVHVEQLAELVDELRAELVEAQAMAKATEAVAQAQVAAMRELVDELKAQLADLRRPWWKRWLG